MAKTREVEPAPFAPVDVERTEIDEAALTSHLGDTSKRLETRRRKTAFRRVVGRARFLLIFFQPIAATKRTTSRRAACAYLHVEFAV
jgi:hypothetical protein